MSVDDEGTDLDGIDEFIFCEGCGARLAPGARTCPKCGRPAPGILSTDSAAADLAAGKTASFPRLGSLEAATQKKTASAPQILASTLDAGETAVLDGDALASALDGGALPTGSAGTAQEGKAAKKRAARARRREEPDYPTEEDFSRPRRGRWIALCLALCLVAAAAWFVVQDPLGVMPGFYEAFAAAAADAFPSRYVDAEEEDAQEETSEANEPELVDATLSDAEVYERLVEIYQKIVDFQDQIGEVVSDYNSWYIASDYSKREEGSQSAYEMREDVQAVLDELAELSLADDSVYTEDVEHLVQLATWMYNRVDVLCESWDISLALDEDESPSSHRSEIVAPIIAALDANGDNQDVVQFETYIDEWEPEEKTSGS